MIATVFLVVDFLLFTKVDGAAKDKIECGGSFSD